jgi:tetratricopeptide (TPR) repeat protein
MFKGIASYLSVFSSTQPSAYRRRWLAGLLCIIAAMAWGIIFYHEYQDTKVQRHIQRGTEYALQGERERAKQEWLEAVRLNPRQVEGWKLLGEYYRFHQQWEQALHAYRQIARYRPQEEGIYTTLAEFATNAGDIASARRYVDQALKQNPNDVSALALGQSLWSQKGEEQQRLKYLRPLVKRQPDSIERLMALVEVLIHELSYEEARPYVEHILKLNPYNAQAYAIRGFLQMVGNTSPKAMAQAEADLRHSLQLDPKNPFALFQLARLYKRQGKLNGAIALLEQAGQLGADRFNIFYELALAYEQKGDKQRATKARQRFETIRRNMDRALLLEKRCIAFPNHFEYHLEYGLLLTQTGDYQKAQEVLHRALEIRPGDARAKAALKSLSASLHKDKR